MKMTFYCNCVEWPRHDVQYLSDMIDDALEITRRTFLKHVDRNSLKGLERELGYEMHPKQGLTMSGDWAVSYHRSKLHSERVYYFRQSAIEYVFKN